ncbi:hypothetical protein ACFQDN_08645 [Pseudomonas asuensis]
MQHILVVDDDTQIAALFESFLEASGYRVTVAHDGFAALQADAEMQLMPLSRISLCRA